MSALSVIDGVLKYKQTSYQISQMTSVKPVTVTRERKINYVSLKSVLPLTAVCISTFLLGMQAIDRWVEVALVLFGVSIGCAWYGWNRVNTRIAQNQEESQTRMYGISLYMANGDRELFVSSKKDTIMQVYDGVHDAMKGKSGNLVDLKHAQIQISDVNNVTIGSIDA